MYILIGALLLFTSIGLLSLLVTFYISVMMKQASVYPEPALNAIIMTQISMFVNQIIDAISDLTTHVTVTSFTFGANTLVNVKKFAQLAVLAVILLEISGNTDVFLTTGDSTYRCVIQPFFQNFMLSIGQIARLIFDAVTPLYNYNYVVTSQATSGSIAIAIKCDLSTVVETIKLILQTFVAMFESIFYWTAAGEMSVENNVFTNELNVTEIVDDVQKILSHQQEITSCICDGLADVIDIGFTVVRQKELPMALNHLFNFPVAFLQTFFQLMPMFGFKFPTMNKPLHYLNGFFFYMGKYLDKVTEEVLTKSIALFDDTFHLEGIPEEFFFTTVSRFLQAGTHVVHTIYRSVIHLMIPIERYVTDADYMMKAWRFDQAVQQYHLGVYNLANNAYWIFEITDKFTKEITETVLEGGEFAIVGIPKHVNLDCSPSDKWTVAASCVPYMSALLPVNVFYIASNMIGEILWKSAFTKEQDWFRTIQRYDGPSYGRNTAITCKYRKSITWDLTTNPDHCFCDIPKSYNELNFSTEFPFGKPTFDPYCGQPNVQAHVLGYIDRGIQLVSTGGGLADKVKDFTVTTNLLSLEFWRSIIKLVLNFDTIATGDYFDRKVNCGYGVSEKRLEEWFLDSGYTIQACTPAKAGYMTYKGSCKPVHTTIRAHMCDLTMNSVQGLGGEVPVCTQINKQGCRCNLALPLEDDNLCACIFYFPDREKTVAQSAFLNPMMNKIYDKSEHWCNSFHFEWGFYHADRFATVIDRFLAVLHPAYDASANSYCENKAYEMTSTDIIGLSQVEFRQEQKLYDLLAITYSTKSCKLYGAHDFICSTSLTLRNGVRTIISLVRNLLMDYIYLGSGGKLASVELGNRLCDLQRTAAGLASTMAEFLSIFTGVRAQGTRAGIAHIFFNILDTPIEIGNALNVALKFFMRVIQGKAFARGVQQPVFDFLLAELDIAVNWLKGFLQGFATLFDSIKNGAGDIFKTFENIVVILRNLLSDAAIEFMSLLIKIGAGLLNQLTSGTAYSGFIDDVFSLVDKFVAILLKNAGKVVDIILKMLGPVGNFIREVSGEICNAIQGVLCGLTFGDFCDMGCIGFEPASFSAPPVVAEVASAVSDAASDVGDWVGGLFGRRLHSSLHTLPKIMAEQLIWNGTSDCDIFVHAYKDYNYTELRPMERITLINCLEQRHLAHEMGKQTGLPIPVDIVYNWKRKYIVMHDFFISGMLYWKFIAGKKTNVQLIREMKQANVDSDLFLPFWRGVRNGVKHMTTATHIDSFIHTVFHEFDPSIKTADTAFGNIYRMYNHTSKAAFQIIDHIENTDFTQQVASTSFAIQQVNITLPEGLSVQNHLQHAYHTWSHTKLRTTYTKSPSKLKARHFVLHAAGLNSDITPCNQQEDSHVCINCQVVDNFINTVITEGDRMRKYYQYTFAPVIVPSFVQYFEDQEAESRAWRADVGDMMNQAAVAAGNNIDDWSEKQFEAINKGYKLGRKFKLHSNTSSLSVWRRARKDWEYLFTNFNVRNNQQPIKILEQFISNTDDTYVPFFGHNLAWFVTYPFAGECSMEIIYCNAPEYQDTKRRLDYIEDSLYYMLYMTIALFVFQWFTGLPVLTITAVYLPIVFAFTYVLTVYGWILPCFPNIPQCAVDDIYAFISDRVFPACWCSYFPGLAQNCNMDNCFLCSRTTTYASCEANISDLKELSIFWAPLFWLRINYPDTLLFFYKTIPFSWILRRYDVIQKIFQEIVEDVKVTQLQLDCLRLHTGDFILIGMVIYVSLTALTLVVPAAVRSIQHAMKLVILLTNILYSMSVSIELNTVSGITNTYQPEGL